MYFSKEDTYVKREDSRRQVARDIYEHHNGNSRPRRIPAFFSESYEDDPRPESLNSDWSGADNDDVMNRRTSYYTGYTREQEAGRLGKIVTFYRNGDSHFRGLTTSVGKKSFPTFETLLVWLNEKIATAAGVRYVFDARTGREVTEIDHLEKNHPYAVSSVKKFMPGCYGDSREGPWINRAPSAGRIRKDEQQFFASSNQINKSHSYPNSRTGTGREPLPGSYWPPGGGVSVPRPRVLNMISNTDRNSCQKVILNPQTIQTFEEMLVDIGNMLRLDNPPVTALYTAKQPYKKVQGFSHLIRTLKNHQEFLVCGQEMWPAELRKQTWEDENQTTYRRHRHKAPPNGYKRGTAWDIPVHDQSDFADRFSTRDSPDPSEKPPTRTITKRRSDSHGEVVNGPIKTSRSPPPAPRNHHQERVNPQQRSYPPLPNNEDFTPRSRVRKAVTKQPHRQPLTETDVAKVDIHGNPREFYAPRYAEMDPDGAKPLKKLKLDWVYGYRGRDARNNLHVLPSGELLYYVAAVVVIYDRKREKQFYYMGHTEDVTCMAVHPSRNKPCVATGQLAGKGLGNEAHIRIWDPRTLQTLSLLGMNVFQGGVSSVAFSEHSGLLDDGSLLLAVDEGDKHTLSVWKWQKEHMVAKTTTSSDTVVWCNFHPHDYSVLLTYGKQHLYFWKLRWEMDNCPTGKIFRDKKSGLFEEEHMPKFVTSLAFSRNGDVITGDSNGRIVVWSRDNADVFSINYTCSDYLRHAHSKSVFTLCMMDDGTLLSGGGNEIKAWDSMSNYQPVKDRLIPEPAGYVRTLVPQNDGGADGNLFIGTTKNLIMEGSLQDKFNYVVQGHSEELWGICPHPSELMFVTAGFDQHVTMWNTLRHKVQWRVNIERPCLSVAVDPDGKVVVVGTTDGRLVALNAANGLHVTSVQVGQEQLDALTFSPDGKLLAMGSHDCNIYVFEVLDEGHVFRKYKTSVLRGHKNFITHLDWSIDGAHLQSISGDYDLLFWDVERMREINPDAARSVAWKTQTSVLGFTVLGAWSNLLEGEDINTMDRSPQSDLLAVGDNQGCIKMYRYPCVSEKPEYHLQKRYSGHVSKVRFTFDGGYLLSSGGPDAGIMQWSVVDLLDYTVQ